MLPTTSSAPTVNAGHIFAINLDDPGPGNKASLTSLALHAMVALGLVAVLSAPTQYVRKSPRAVMLQESKLLDPALPAKTGGMQGGSGGAREHTPASHGISLPPTTLRAQFSPLKVPLTKPRLPVSPSLIEAEPPKIEPSLQYGDPNSGIQFLSAGWGTGGIGSGASLGTGSSTSTGAATGNGNSGAGNLVFSMGDLSVMPVLIYKVDPEYTDQAKLSKYQGTVLLNLVIDDKGRPQQVRVARPLGLGLDEKAVEAVRHWRFRPGIKNGNAVAVAANVEVNFQLF